MERTTNRNVCHLRVTLPTGGVGKRRLNEPGNQPLNYGRSSPIIRLIAPLQISPD